MYYLSKYLKNNIYMRTFKAFYSEIIFIELDDMSMKLLQVNNKMF